MKLANKKIVALAHTGVWVELRVMDREFLASTSETKMKHTCSSPSGHGSHHKKPKAGVHTCSGSDGDASMQGHMLPPGNHTIPPVPGTDRITINLLKALKLFDKEVNLNTAKSHSKLFSSSIDK